MRVEKKSADAERRVLTAMVVDQTVLGKVSGKWEKDGLFESEWSNLVAKWCVDYYLKYDKPPGKNLEGLYAAWADGADEETAKLVAKFLSSLSGEYANLKKQVNPDYAVDLATRHFNKVKLRRLMGQLEGDVDGGDLDKAHARIVNFCKVDVAGGHGVDVLSTPLLVKDAVSKKADVVIKYPGAIGNFFGNRLERDGFVAFMAPEKTGKSFWLFELAWAAVLQQRRVAYFEAGDMSQHQVMRRVMARATKKPFEAGQVRYPKSLDPGGEAVAHDVMEFKDDLDAKEAYQAFQAVKKKNGNAVPFRMSCHPNSTLSVPGVVGTLRAWERAGWVPDVVVVDYADILAPINGAAETRDQINATWKALRALSQSHHCLVVTATQANAASYRAETVDKSNFSEDKRKLAHVTALYGINQTPSEKENQIYRLNAVVAREGEFSSEKCVYCAACLPLARPVVLSTF